MVTGIFLPKESLLLPLLKLFIATDNASFGPVLFVLLYYFVLFLMYLCQSKILQRDDYSKDTFQFSTCLTICTISVYIGIIHRLKEMKKKYFHIPLGSQTAFFMYTKHGIHKQMCNTQ